MEEGGNTVSKVGGRLCVTTGGATLGGIVGMKSTGVFHGRGGINDVAQHSVRFMVEGVNISWERIYGSAITAATRDGFCCWRRESIISILQILTPRRYSCSVSALLRMKKDSITRTKVSGSWQAVCRQRSRRGFVMIQEKSTQPRAPIPFCSALVYNGREVSSDSVKLWWLGRCQHKCRARFEQKLQVLFIDTDGAVE